MRIAAVNPADDLLFDRPLDQTWRIIRVEGELVEVLIERTLTLWDFSLERGALRKQLDLASGIFQDMDFRRLAEAGSRRARRFAFLVGARGFERKITALLLAASFFGANDDEPENTVNPPPADPIHQSPSAASFFATSFGLRLRSALAERPLS